MINETSSANNNPFFMDVKMAKGNKKTDDSYDAVLKNAMDDKEVKPLATKPVKMDKPKIGNREPFFPEQAMPYHPEVKSTDEYQETDQAGEDMQDAELIDKILQRARAQDDQAGLMNHIFDSSKVSYPVKQVAKESLDEDVVQSLMAQGLWNMPAMYTAKPSENFASVMENQQVMLPVQKPVAQFMASMENELGVSPDRLVQAYSELSPGQLQKNPVETMAEVIKQLDLPPADEKKAAELYGKMLDQLQKVDEKQLSADDEAKKLLATAMLAKGAEKAASMKELKTDDFSQTLPKLKQENSIKANQQNANSNANAFMTEQKNSSQMQQNQSEGQSAKGFTKENLKQEFGKNLDAKVTQHHPASFDSQLQPLNTLATGEALATKAGETNTANRAETLQSIVNNAQALSQKGGGEMKMVLKPEHLGEIQLKVSMNGNQVNVSMVTEKPEAKKLLEQNIQELRHGLASHGLSMEKLDVGLNDKNAGFQNQQNGKPDFNQAREFAQQFNNHQSRSGDQKLDDLRSGKTATRSMLKSKSQNTAMKIPERRGEGRLNVVA